MNMDTQISIAIKDSNLSEEKWMKNMKILLNNQNHHQQIDDQNSISIFQVPKPLKSIKFEAYTPQFIAIGPYHNFNPNLYNYQSFKLYQAQIFHQKFNLPNFQILTQQIERKVIDFKSYYNEDLVIKDETLSLMMVIDGLFLLRLIYNTQGSETEFFDESGRKFSVDSILRDSVLIENQIPFFVLEHLVARRCSKSSSKITSLLVMAIKICPRISPISLEGKFFKLDFINPFHLLDLLYNLVLFGGSNSIKIPTRLDVESSEGSIRSKISQLLGMITPAEEDEKDLIPNASQLSGDLKVNFFGGIGIRFIRFRQEDASLHLPILTLNSHSDAVIRNLITYEAMTRPESPDFARYIEMMSAMIRTVEDVEVLRRKGIVKYEGDSGEVVKLFKGISFVEGKYSELIDGIIKGINLYYYNNWRTKLKKVLKKYVYGSWKMFTVLATVWLLLLTTLQTFCSIYNCPGLFKTRVDFQLDSIF